MKIWTRTTLKINIVKESLFAMFADTLHCVTLTSSLSFVSILYLHRLLSTFQCIEKYQYKVLKYLRVFRDHYINNQLGIQTKSKHYSLVSVPMNAAHMTDIIFTLTVPYILLARRYVFTCNSFVYLCKLFR